MWWLMLIACGPAPKPADDAGQDTPPDTDVEVESDPPDASDPPDDPPDLYDDPCVTAPSEVDIGTGEDVFEPVAAGGPLPLWQGAQEGVGFHFFLSLRASRVPELVRLEYGVRDVLTGEALDADPAHPVLNLRLATEALGAPWECVGFQRGIKVPVRTDGLDEEPRDAPEDLCGREVELWARLSAVDGTVLVEDALRAVARQDAATLEGCPEWTLVLP